MNNYGSPDRRGRERKATRDGRAPAGETESDWDGQRADIHGAHNDKREPHPGPEQGWQERNERKKREKGEEGQEKKTDQEESHQCRGTAPPPTCN